MITIFLDEVLWSPFYMEFVKNSLDNERAPFHPNLSKGFLGERRIAERDGWVKGGCIMIIMIILGNDGFRR